MTVRQIEAGKATVEVGIRDKYTASLARVQAKMKAFAGTAKAIGAGMTAVGARLSAIGAVGLAGFGSALQEFLELPKRAKEMGRSLSGIDVSKSERLDKAWRGLLATFGAFKFVIGNAIAGPLTDAAVRLAQVFRIVAQFAAQSPFAVKAIAAVFIALAGAGAILLAGGAAFAALGSAAGLAGAAIGAVGVPLTATVAILGGLTAALGVASFAWADFGTAVVTAMTVAMRAVEAMANVVIATLNSMITATETALKMLAKVALLVGTIGVPMGKDLRKILEERLSPDGFRIPRIPTADFPSFQNEQLGQAMNSAQFNAGSIMGSSRGTFQGLRAENLSVSSGGGVEDRRARESRERMDEMIRVLRDIFGAVKNDKGPVFQN